jgi:two-component system chemotaxis sensor kinase CheA
MLELAQKVDIASLVDKIDELSTRLILDGVATLQSVDFESLSGTAAQLDCIPLSEAALRIAKSIAARSLAVPELTGLVSSGLVELRRLLDEPAVAEPAVFAPSPGKPESPDPVHTTNARTNSLAADEELIREFITESSEHLATIESRLLVLEKDNSATETLNAIFRGFHTIKGLAGFLEFSEIQALTHEVETLLDLARTAQLTVTPEVVDVVLESTDIVRHELAVIVQRLNGETPSATKVDDAVLERIRHAARGGAAPMQRDATPELSTATVVAEQIPATSMQLASASPAREVTRPEAAASAVSASASSAGSERRPADSSSVRIDTAKLDQLMDMVGEMVIAQTLIGHSTALESIKDAKFQRNLTQLARITADVQRITTGMRMVPIGIQFSKTARVVRDLARRAGKQIEFEATGEETELDKSIAEELSDPLLHMVRNSIDHGIEPPEERIAKGKPPTAHIRVSAYHQSGQIVVAISDDGRGLDREKILAKAQQNGLIQHGAQLSDSEIFLLIFEAGFSTAEKITDISGRGVGMDVVRRHVQKLRGHIDIQSKAGEGTTFFIKLPLTLAIIEGLVVVVGQQRYIVPIFSVREMFRPTPEMLSTVQGVGEMAMVRGGLMPIVRLHRRFGMEARTTDFTEGTLIVAESQGRQFCLFVDDLIGKQEVVIKSLGQRFKNVTGVAGCAILGDGRVGLILDMDGIFKGRA